jgi:hypothetical protein
VAEDQSEQILEARAEGKSVRTIARELDLTLREVEDGLKAALERIYSGEGLRESVGLALHRLERMELKYHDIAMKAEGGDPACAMIALKSNERRAVLSGSTPPIGFAVRHMVDAAPEQLTSTGELRAVLDRLRYIVPRERELLNRAEHGDGPLDEVEADELRQLQAESQAKREASP